MTHKHADRMVKHRDRVAEAMAMLTNARLAEIDERSRFEPTIAANGSGGRSSDISRPTEQAAIRNIDGRQIGDPQATAFRIIDAELRSMATSSTRITNAWTLIAHIADGRRGRETLLDTCNACQRTDLPERPVNGYCPACRMAWVRAGHPDRMMFELTRRVAVE
jgi:hypothetical protein